MILDAARNLYEGKGLVSNVVIPPYLLYYKDVHPPTPYSLYPLLPLVTSWLFHLFGVRAGLLLVLPVICYFLAAFALYALGRRLFGSTAALAGAGFLLIQPALIETTIGTSFSDPVMAFLLITSVLCIFLARDSERSSSAWLILAGVTLGIAQYARFAGLLLYLPMAFLILSAFSGRRLVRLALFLAACFMVQLPIFIWNLKTVGSFTLTPTFHLLFLTPSFPGLSAFTQLLPTSPAAVMHLYGGDILQKWLSQVWVHYKYLYTMMNPLVLVAALLTFSIRLNKPQALLRNFAAVLYLCLAAQNSLNIWDNRYLLPVVPFLGLLGCAFLRTTIADLPIRPFGRPVAAAILALLVSNGTIDFFYQALKHRGAQLRSRQAQVGLTQFVKDHVRPDAVVMSTDVGSIAWENGNVAIELPADFETAARIYRDFIRFDTVILSDPLHHGGLYQYSPDWAELVAGRKTFLDFRPEQEFTLASGERIVLLRDRAKR